MILLGSRIAGSAGGPTCVRMTKNDRITMNRLRVFSTKGIVCGAVRRIPITNNQKANAPSMKMIFTGMVGTRSRTRSRTAWPAWRLA
jgi:hypothetical protein